MTQARVRRRGGLVPRLLFAFALAYLVIEVGLRFVLGNGGHGFVIQPAREPSTCWELVPASFAPFTGDATRQPRSSIHVNRLGARSPEPEPPSPDRMRIVVLGDGLVFGHGVDDDETLSARIGDELGLRGHANDVLSFGVPGLSPAQSVAAFEQRLPKLQADLVLLVVSPDDLDPGAEECPHGGMVRGDGKVSSLAARDQLRTLVATRSYALRAYRLIRDAGWSALLDPNGPYGPGREPLGVKRPPGASVRASADLPPGPWFAAAASTPEQRWGDVPILMPSEREVPAIVAQGKQEYVFIEAVQRLAALGVKHDVQVAVAVAADRTTFQRVTSCATCRTPQTLLRGVDVRRIDLSALWLQLLRSEEQFFQIGEGYPNAAGHDELGRALAGELAGMAWMRER